MKESGDWILKSEASSSISSVRNHLFQLLLFLDIRQGEELLSVPKILKNLNFLIPLFIKSEPNFCWLHFPPFGKKSFKPGRLWAKTKLGNFLHHKMILHYPRHTYHWFQKARQNGCIFGAVHKRRRQFGVGRERDKISLKFVDEQS